MVSLNQKLWLLIIVKETPVEPPYRTIFIFIDKMFQLISKIYLIILNFKTLFTCIALINLMLGISDCLEHWLHEKLMNKVTNEKKRKSLVNKKIKYGDWRRCLTYKIKNLQQPHTYQKIVEKYEKKQRRI